MKKMEQRITVRSDRTPRIEIDPRVKAAYIRFSDAPVAKTRTLDRDGCLVTADLDEAGEIVGIELIGVEFSVKAFRNAIPIDIPSEVMEGATWMPAAA